MDSWDAVADGALAEGTVAEGAKYPAGQCASDRTGLLRRARGVWRAFAGMARIGVMGFGGGNALVPVIEREVVADKGPRAGAAAGVHAGERPLTQEEYDRAVVVANITPGALPVEVASSVGERLAGPAGMVAGAVGMGLPGALLSFLLLAAFSYASSAVELQVSFASVGIGMLIVYVLVSYVMAAVRQKAAHSVERAVSVALVAAVFAVTCGKQLARVIGWNPMPFSLSTLEVLGLAFFVIFYTGGGRVVTHTVSNCQSIGRGVRAAGASNADASNPSAAAPASDALRQSRHASSSRLLSRLASGLLRRGVAGEEPRWLRGAVAAALVVAYVAGVNGCPGLSLPQTCVALRVTMVALGAWGFGGAIVADGLPEGGFAWGRLLRGIGAWCAFMAVCCLPALLLVPNAAGFLGNGAASVLMSFGGGDAYLAIGHGLFVDSGLVSSAQYYGQVATISNAMPGSIICKVLSGVGYLVGYQQGFAAGAWLALAGFAVGVGFSGLSFLVMYHVYERFERLCVFCLVKRYIRPIIGGLLLTVALGMVGLNLEVAPTTGVGLVPMIVISAAVFALVWWLGRVREVSLGKLVLVAAGVSLALCNLAVAL
ncbi:MAG: chromate transporter [Atopobiaceae bacterium]